MDFGQLFSPPPIFFCYHDYHPQPQYQSSPFQVTTVSFINMRLSMGGKMHVEFICGKFVGKQECLTGKLTRVFHVHLCSRLLPGNVGRGDLHSRRLHSPDFSGILCDCPVAGKLARACNVLDHFFSPLSGVLGRKHAICWKFRYFGTSVVVLS